MNILLQTNQKEFDSLKASADEFLVTSLEDLNNLRQQIARQQDIQAQLKKERLELEKEREVKLTHVRIKYENDLFELTSRLQHNTGARV